MKTVLAALFLCSVALAQNPAQIIPTTINPTGQTCNSTRLNEKTPDGIIYSCQNGSMAALGGGGASPSPSVSVTFSSGATTGTLTHNFASTSHIDQCIDVNNSEVYPQTLTLGLNADSFTFSVALNANTVCTATSGGTGGPPTGNAGGDLGSTFPNPTVVGIKSVPFCTGYTPTNGQAVEYTTGGSPNPCYTATAPGTVTSVGLLGTANEITVTGASPITSSGSWTLSIPSAAAFPGLPTVGTTATTGDSSLNIADTAFVAAVVASVNVAVAVQAATTTALPNTPTYNNGTAGVGATLTASTNTTIGTIDGYTPSLNDRLLIQNQATTANNGVYTLTQVGSGAAPWILTRAVDYNSPSNINYTGIIYVNNGTTQGGDDCNGPTNVTAVGTSAITFTCVASTGGGGNVKATGNLANGDVITGAGGKNVKDSGTALTALAPLASPTFTGTPAAPTAAVNTNTTQLATTAYVKAVTTLASLSSANGTTIPASSTLTTTVGSGTIALTTSAISSGACSTASTVTITGTATTDAVIATLNADPTGTTGYAPSTSGSLYIYVYPTTNTVNAKACNNTSASITPGAATLNVRVVR